MKNLLLYLLILLRLDGCNNSKSSDMVCNKKNAQAITDKLIEQKEDIKVSDMHVTIKQDSLHFIIEYLPKNKMTLGNGGKFLVLMSNCKVVEQRFYQ